MNAGPLIRPELRAGIWRWREVIASALAALFGLWLIALGGLVLIPLGVLTCALAAGLGLLAWRKMRFAQPGIAPGVVEVVEGQISYFGPAFGGSLALPDLAEIRLLTSGGRRLWRLKTTDSQALLIPVEAVGGERLFDTFAALPGMSTQTLVAALTTPDSAPAIGTNITHLPQSRLIWRHPARAVLT